jgi:multicomponent Na+:H+ antiporter subunit D
MVAALNEGHPIVWLALLFASAGVFHHAGIKIPFFAFFSHDSGIRCEEAPRNMLIAMGVAAAVCVFNGSYPWVLYSMLPYPVDYAPYTWAHVLSQFQLLFFSALAFCLLKLSGLYPPELPGINIDAEWSYRRLLPRLTRGLVKAFAPLDRGVRNIFLGGVNGLISGVSRYIGPGGVMAKSLPAGDMVFWAIAFLAIYLIVYFV